MEFDGNNWHPFQPDPTVPVNVMPPIEKTLEGFDVVAFQNCSPLSCNGLAQEVRTNEHCLLSSFDEAQEKLTHGAFHRAEPGPYRIFAVYSAPWACES
jgi:hypothetical protein